MSKSTDTTSVPTDDSVAAAVEAGKARLADVRNRIQAARVILGESTAKRDQSIADAERVYSSEYSKGRTDMQAELRDLDEGYQLLRKEITERYSNELESLNEARDVAVNSAMAEFESTREATQVTFGEG